MRGTTGSTSFPGRIGPGSSFPRGRPAVLGLLSSWRWPHRVDSCPEHSGPCPRVQSVGQHPQLLVPSSEVPRNRRALLGDSGPGPMAHGLNKLAWVTHAVFQSSRNRPVVLGDSGPCPRSRGIDPLSRVTWAQVRGPSVYTNCPGMLRTGSEGPRFLPAVPEDSHQCPSSRGFHQLSQATHDEVRGPAMSTSCPG